MNRPLLLRDFVKWLEIQGYTIRMTGHPNLPVSFVDALVDKFFAEGN